VSDSGHLPWSVLVAFALLAVLSAGFVGFFLLPAARVAFRLKSLCRSLSRTDTTPNLDLTPLFQGVEGLERPWREFRETLHEERAVNLSSGELQIVALRATVPAETFFTESYVVDGPLATEFFKHLPGIFTGIGIIGTFLGLLRGLRAFQVTDDPTTVHTSLEQLMHGVSDAFMVSFAAIALAMLITFVEKLVLVRLSARLRKLTQAIDERFKAGVGEEYLSRLVGAAEESAVQARILKNALVGDLRTILKEVSQYQIKAFRTAQQALGQYIGDTMALQLRAPMLRLADATEKVRADQDAALEQLMGDMLLRFSERLQYLLGGEISGIHDFQQRMINALSDVVTQLQHMVGSIEVAGRREPDPVGERVAETLHKLDQRQLVINEEVRRFAGEIRSVIGQSHASHRELQGLLSALSDKVTTVIGELSVSSQSTVASMNAQIGNVASSLTAFTARLDAVVTRLDSLSLEATRAIHSNEDRLAGAANEFSIKGESVSAVLARADPRSRELTQSSATRDR
jgi:hypothetical protein